MKVGTAEVELRVRYVLDDRRWVLAYLVGMTWAGAISGAVLGLASA